MLIFARLSVARLSVSCSILRSHFGLSATKPWPAFAVTAIMEPPPTLVVCSSKVRGLAKRLQGSSALAEHILGFAIADGIMLEAHPEALPDHCRKCRAAAIVEMTDRRVQRAFFCCLRERRLQLERVRRFHG